jgi:V-type H+-transporting ATPase subunit C
VFQEANSIDNDVRSKYNQYNSLRTNLQTLVRKQTGNLSTKSLVSVVPPGTLITDSEHLETHLVAVPNNNVKDFMRTYETLAPMVVPRSASFVVSDDEFSLYAVTTFKKHSPEFVHKVREKKWIPRDYKYKEGGKEEEQKEVKRVEAEEKKVWGETLRLGRTGWSEGVMCLVHVIVLRVFVETVLRYGLPLDYVSVLVKVSTWASLAETCKHSIVANKSPRPTPNEKSGYYKTLIPSMHIWPGMHLGRIRKADQRKTKA